jgi:Zn-dependent protease
VGVLRFRLFGFPVDVQPGFWVLALIVAAGAQKSALEVAVLIGVIVVSVLAHELGHATAARVYGESPRITLHMMGGLTSFSPARPHGRKQSILITLAGPFAGFALSALAFGILLSLPAGRRESALGTTLEWLWVINAFWSVVNLLPVLPFDGGQVLAAALGPSRRRLAASLSLVFGVVTAVVFWKAGMVLGAAFFALGAVTSFFAAREPERAALSPAAVAELLGRARAALDAGEHAKASTLARATLEQARDAETARRAVEIGAWAALLGGDAPAARAALRTLPRELPPDALLEAAVLEADGDLGGATVRLLAARRDGDARPELAGLLVRLLLAQGRLEEAVRLTEEIFDSVEDEEVQRVAAQAAAGGAEEASARLRERLRERSERGGSAA